MPICDTCGERNPEDCRCKYEQLYKLPRPVEDADIVEMIEFWKHSHMDGFATFNTRVMLQELLEHRRKERAHGQT